MPDTSHLTQRAREVFATYLHEGQRDIDTTARLQNMPAGQVNAMAERYGFLELATESDVQRTVALVAYSRRKLAENLPAFADTLIEAASNRSTEKGNWPAHAVTPVALKSALHSLAAFGISPLKRADLTLLHADDRASLGRGPDDALVARLIEDGDTQALTRLAAGLSLPASHGQATTLPATPPPGTPPPDFTSDQPGGRVGSDPSNPLNPDGEVQYRVLSDEEWSGEQSGAAEFVFGEQPDGE